MKSTAIYCLTDPSPLLPQVNKNHTRMISITYVLTQIFIILGMKYEFIPLPKSKRTLRVSIRLGGIWFMSWLRMTSIKSFNIEFFCILCFKLLLSIVSFQRGTFHDRNPHLLKHSVNNKGCLICCESKFTQFNFSCIIFNKTVAHADTNPPYGHLFYYTFFTRLVFF